MNFRQATVSDQPHLLELDPSATADSERAIEFQRGIELGTLWVVEGAPEGQPIGYALLDHNFYGRGFVHLLYVRAQSRRSGVGSVLLEGCERRCRTDKLFTSTNLSNQPMQALLSSRGFRLSGLIENLDEGDPELVYFKSIPAQPA